MSAQFMQFLLTGLTVGAIYALVALGFSIIFNASHVINFAQGEFVMIGGMATVSFADAGLPPALAIPAAVLAAIAVGLALAKFAVERARGASVVTLWVKGENLDLAPLLLISAKSVQVAEVRVYVVPIP